MKTIYLKSGAKEQLDNAGVNPWFQPIEFNEKKTSEFNEELSLDGNELFSLRGNEFFPEEIENLEEIKQRIIIIE
ncbi:hypothetical protein GW932_01450 [archaeon]|nr:hypothetical protein [archaeon]